jgi:hypothetical protein
MKLEFEFSGELTGKPTVERQSADGQTSAPVSFTAVRQSDGTFTVTITDPALKPSVSLWVRTRSSAYPAPVVRSVTCLDCPIPPQ